jgi:hypothetical protein
MGKLKDFKTVDISELSIPGDQKTVIMSKEDWTALGTQLFGPDMMNWRFVCPACGNVAAVKDFYQYRDKGAQPNAATCDCIGRYDGHIHVEMGAGKPCNYTGYGLIDLCPVRVMDGDEEVRCFAFEEKSGG